MTLLEALGRGIPDDRLVTDADVVASLSGDEAEWAHVGAAAVALRARTEAEVAHAVTVCADLGVPLVPRGAGTGLSGGANAVDGCVVLDLSRMTAVREVDAENLIAVVEPGIVNDDLKAVVAEPVSTPRKPRRSQTRVRTRAEFSPMPAVKASASRAVQRHRHRADGHRDAIRVDVEREVADLAHVAAAAAERFHPGFEVQLVVERRVDAALSQQVDERAGVDRAGARRHRDALERAEAHRRVDGAPVANGGIELPPPR